MSAELRARAISQPPTWRERYEELAWLGYADHQMPSRLGVTPRSLVRMMVRDGLVPSQLLKSIADAQRHR